MPESTPAAGAAIVLGFDPTTAVVVQEASAATSDVMKVRVPFYVGNSIAQAPGFALPIYFPTATLPGIVQEAQGQITEGKQPLTVYARHHDALDPKEVPIGRIVECDQDGSTGYAILAISKVGKGAIVQQLIRDGVINAVSLRSRGDWEMDKVKVNGNLMFEAKRLPLAGIDFAPEGPAQPTYGVEILQEAARVEPADQDPAPPEPPVEPTAPPKEEPDSMEITLEAVRAKSDIVEAIEKPLRDELKAKDESIVSLERERDEFKAKVVTLEAAEAAKTARAAIDTFLTDTVAKLPEASREAALKVLQEKVAEVKDVDEAKVILAPVMLDLSLKIAAAGPIVPEEAPANVMRDAADILFDIVRPNRSQVVTQEGEVGATAPERQKVMGMEIPD